MSLPETTGALHQPTPAISDDAPRSWARIDGVDLLRGLAIFLVLMNHVNMRLFLAKVPYTQGLPAQLVSTLVWSGQYGVQMFFAVSGFLITSTSIRRWGSLSQIRVRDFYALRFARIAPLLLLLLAILSTLHAVGLKDFVVSGKTGGLGRALVAALAFHVNVLEAHRGYLPGNWDILWSLSVEETFYLIFPLACRLFRRGKGLTIFLWMVVALGPFARTMFAHGNEIWQEYSYLGGMDAIALGCLTALASSRTTMHRSTARAIGMLGAALLLFILGCSHQMAVRLLGHIGIDMTILAIGSCMVIAAAAQSQWRSPRVLSPLMTLGRRSYEVYLTHMFIVFALFEVFKSAFAPIAVPVFFGTAVLLSGSLGELAARFYSEPMNRLIRQRLGDGPERLGSALCADAAG